MKPSTRGLSLPTHRLLWGWVGCPRLAAPSPAPLPCFLPPTPAGVLRLSEEELRTRNYMNMFKERGYFGHQCLLPAATPASGKKEAFKAEREFGIGVGWCLKAGVGCWHTDVSAREQPGGAQQ